MATPFSSVPWLANPGAWWARDTAAGQLGVQIARNQIAAEGQRAQLQKEAQLLPLQKAAIEASTKLHEMQMRGAELGIQHELAQQAGEKDLAEAVVTAGEIGWQDQQVPWLLGKVGAAHPSLLDSPVFRQAMDWHNKARSAQDFVDRSAGNLEARESALELRRQLAAAEKQYAPSDRQKAVEDVFSEEVNNRAVRGLPPMTDVEASDLRKSLLNSSFPSRDNVESTTMGTDAEGKPYLRIQKGGRDTNIATENRIQTNLLRDEKLNGQLLGLRTDLRWQDVGIAGTAGELLGDRVLPQFGFNTSDPARMKNRTELKAALISAHGSLTADQRLSNYDKQALAAMGPSDTWTETVERARQAARTLGDITKDRAQIDANMAKMPIQDWMLTQRDIENEVQKGTMVPERAFDLKVKYYPDTLTPDEIKVAVKSKKMSNSVGVHLLKTLYPERFPN